MNTNIFSVVFSKCPQWVLKVEDLATEWTKDSIKAGTQGESVHPKWESGGNRWHNVFKKWENIFIELLFKYNDKNVYDVERK